LRSDLITARLDAARLRAALSDGSDPLADFDPPGEASPALIAMQRQFLIDQTSEHRAKLAALDRQKAQKEAERATIAATVGKSTRYGLLHGQVASVSQDAITRDTPQDKDSGRAHNADSSTSEPKGQELAYAARVSLDRTQMQVENNTVNLSPGMAVTVEIKTGSRRVISYLLSPLLRYKQETLRER
jgi:hemolysin D